MYIQDRWLFLISAMQLEVIFSKWFTSAEAPRMVIIVIRLVDLCKTEIAHHFINMVNTTSIIEVT